MNPQEVQIRTTNSEVDFMKFEHICIHIFDSNLDNTPYIYIHIARATN